MRARPFIMLLRLYSFFCEFVSTRYDPKNKQRGCFSDWRVRFWRDTGRKKTVRKTPTDVKMIFAIIGRRLRGANRTGSVRSRQYHVFRRHASCIMLSSILNRAASASVFILSRKRRSKQGPSPGLGPAWRTTPTRVKRDREWCCWCLYY